MYIVKRLKMIFDLVFLSRLFLVYNLVLKFLVKIIMFLCCFLLVVEGYSSNNWESCLRLGFVVSFI